MTARSRLYAPMMGHGLIQNLIVFVILSQSLDKVKGKREAFLPAGRNLKMKNSSPKNLKNPPRSNTKTM